jgi:plasmid stabilization system protein ParE
MATKTNFEIWRVDELDETKKDITEIADYIAETTGNEIYGNRFANAVETAIYSLKTWPFSQRKFSDEFDDTIRRIEIFDYNAAILYKVYADTFEVIAVLAFHTLSDPESYRRIIAQRVALADKKYATDK